MFDSTVRNRFNTQDKYMVKVPWAGVSEFGDTNPDRPSPSGGIKERPRDPPGAGSNTVR